MSKTEKVSPEGARELSADEVVRWLRAHGWEHQAKAIEAAGLIQAVIDAPEEKKADVLRQALRGETPDAN